MAVCGVLEAACRCVLSEGHAGPHECDPRICGGSWDVGANGEFQIIRLPSIGGR